MSLTTTKGILITGGTGSFGKAFLAELLNRFTKIPRIVIYSRDEYENSGSYQISFHLLNIHNYDSF